MNSNSESFSNSQKTAFVQAFLKAIMIDDRSLGKNEMEHLYRIFSRLSIEPDERQEVVYRATFEPQDIIDGTSDFEADQRIKAQLLIEIFSYLDTTHNRKVAFEDIGKEFSDAQIASLQKEGQQRNQHFISFKEKIKETIEKYNSISDNAGKDIDEENFWRKIKNVAKKMSKETLRLVLVLWYCFRDPDTPKKIKAALAAPLLYFINPFDFIPDFILAFGYTDDAGFIAAAVSLFTLYIKKHHYQQADETLREWFGEKYVEPDKSNDFDGDDETIQEIGRIVSYADTDRKGFEEKRRSETNHPMRVAFNNIIDHLRHISDDYRIVY